MSGLSTTIRIGDGDRIAVRERTTEPGCAITAFCGDVLIFLSAEKEAELLAALLERAPKLPLRSSAEAGISEEALALIASARMPQHQLATLTETDTDLAIVPFPGSGVNFRTVGSFGGGDAA